MSEPTKLSPTRLAPPPLRETLVALWAVLGVAALLTNAVIRLSPLALEPIRDGSMTTVQWILYGAWVLLNAYMEGYRAFQRRFVPRVVARAFHLGRNPVSFIRVFLAPAFAMSLFHATRRSRTVSWSVLIGVVSLVVLVRQLPQPWRGIIDGGVVVGLGWGLVALLAEVVATLRFGALPAPDLPNGLARESDPLGVTAADA